MTGTLFLDDQGNGCSKDNAAQIVSQGQAYRLADLKAHDCQDGRTVLLEGWTSQCATCGTEFIWWTVRRDGAPRRRCDTHKRPGIRA